jgi:probable HAF family extracellular repeat protein
MLFANLLLLAQTAHGQEAQAKQTTSKVAQQNPAAPKMIEVKRGNYTVRLLDNSDTYSQALAINSQRAIIGQREVANEDMTIFSTEYFFFDGEHYQTFPTLEGFSSGDISALSDNHVVAGLASRAIGHPEGSLLAVAWEPLHERLTPLPRPEGDIGSQAHGISADGSRISGYATGPERMRPVVWSKDADGAWQATVLPTVMDENPYIMSSRVLISPDGSLVAACCTVDITNGVYDSDLFLWRDKDGQWEREQISDNQFYLRGMNNSGQIVGSLSTPRGKRLPCVADATTKELKPIALLPGDVTGEALAINAKGTVVGFSDNAAGNDGGPKGFIWREGKTTALNFGPDVYSTANGITDAGEIAGYMDEPSIEGEDSRGRVLAFWTVNSPSK